MGEEEITDLYFLQKKLRLMHPNWPFFHFGVFVYEYLTMLKILIVPRTWGVNELEFGLYRTRKRTFFIPNPSRESYTLYLAVDLQLGMVMILDSKNVLNERFSSYLVRFGPSFPKY